MSNLVLIKSLGIVVPFDVVDTMALNYRVQRKFTLINPGNFTTFSDLMVSVALTYTFGASIQYDPSSLPRHPKELENTILLNARRWEEEAAEKRRQEEEANAPKKRGRKKKVEESDEDDEDDDEEMSDEELLQKYASSFGNILQIDAIEYSYVGGETKLTDSLPWKSLVKVKESYEDKLDARYSEYRTVVQKVVDLRAKLTSPTAESVADSLAGFAIEEEVKSLDSKAVDSFEASISEKINKLETNARTLFTWFDEKIISRANVKSAAQWHAMTDDVTVKTANYTGETVSQTELIRELFKECLIPVQSPFGE